MENEIRSYFDSGNASYIIGYNSRSFDIPVLQAYYPGDTANFTQFDILEDIREKTGPPVGLNDVVGNTRQKKSGHGLMATTIIE
jgi:DEAD/DEAH box helicase domain-containing protein